ncbi:MAG TPA: ATP-binding protein, partial [Kofleriaceae bacterium]|nr:ATP-binding protein [Kofleriaceae bacterium]
MDPYRDVPVADVEAPRDTGIVGDVIAQFADPLAFYRELVQNAIDAGSPTIDVRIDHDDGEQIMRIAVRDRGEGMSRDTIENQLLVLFRSTKENDHTKIGKFGIGFASVLAPKPRLVTVTSTREGRRLALQLHPDLSFGLYDGGAATQTGTVVELEVPVPTAEAVDFIRRSETSLVRWCKHATTPIELTAIVGGVELLRRRIDRPLALDGALIQASGVSEDGALSAVVGLVKERYAGFFNHGLTLYETVGPETEAFSFKVQDSRLGHTISRDDVRRDDAYYCALAFVRQLASIQLPVVAERALRAALLAPDRRGYAELVTELRRASITPTNGWVVPTLQPAGAAEMSALPARVWASARRTPLVSAVQGPVIDLAGNEHWLVDFVEQVGHRRVSRIETSLALIAPVETTPTDLVLIDKLRELLVETHRAPAAIVLASVEGALSERLAFCGDDSPPPWTIDVDESRQNPFALLRRRPLVL